ncbi:MinD/ParA family protein [uncultured Sneathiella sp.]|uniref:MinD/ParA family protein n=1 Tax=uncultured Sneathiella sp. TaxID=879315 RepID=UPI0030ECD762|tara:strand:+ start:14360 stop:15169 length:810 start_codon:yes stop_codon:yes gene_type:complete
MIQTESPRRNRPSIHPATQVIGSNLITVASGKGGVGKTVLAISLTQALAKSGKNVLLFDGDVGLANVDIQLGIMPEKDLASVVTGEMDLKDAVFNCAEGGFDLIAGRSGSGSLGTLSVGQLQKIRQDLANLSSSYDFIILDLGAGIDDAVRTLSGGAGPKLVVTTGDPTSLTDAYAYIKVTSQITPDADLRILVNMVKSEAEGKKVYEKLLTACRNFLNIAPPLAGIIEQDEKVSSAIRAQAGLMTRYPTSRAANAIDNLARYVLKGAA